VTTFDTHQAHPRKRKLDPRAKTARRLIRLADLLEGMPPERFNMDHWMSDRDADGTVLWNLNDMSDAKDMPRFPTCGTQACVAGWAAYLWRDEFIKMPASKQIVQAACDILGFEFTSDWGDEDLFSSSAPWTTPTEAAWELRRRAVRILDALNTESIRRAG
jgi:hypothetical protein